MRLTITLFSLILLGVAVQAQSLDWAHTSGSPGSRCIATDMANDLAGNSYVVVGYFADSVDLDPGPADSMTVSRGGNDLFIQRFSQDGDLLWVRRFGGACDDKALGVDITPDGMIWVAGQFCDSLTWIEDPVEPARIYSAGGMDAFFLQLDSNGIPMIANSFGGTTDDAATDISSIPSGGGITAIAIAGWFTGTADLDPSPSAAISATSNGAHDGFLIRINSSWPTYAATYGGTGEDEVTAVHFNFDGYLTATGFFSNTVDFDPDADVLDRTSNGMTDVFVLRMHQSDLGNLALYTYGGADNDRGMDVLTDSLNTTWVSGSFSGTAVNFDPLGGSAASLTSNGVEDAFLMAYESVTGILHYAHSIGGVGMDAGTTLARLGNGNVVLAGDFMGMVDMDPGPGTVTFLADAEYDAFVATFDATGNFQFAGAVQSGSSAPDRAMGLAVGTANQVLMCGTYGGSPDFDPSSATDLRPAAGPADMFVLKWTLPTATASVDAPALHSSQLGPNPTSGTVAITSEQPISQAVITVQDLTGRLVLRKPFGTGTEAVISLPSPSGIYIVNLQTASETRSWKVVKL